jgi:hypothetical protein
MDTGLSLALAPADGREPSLKRKNSAVLQGVMGRMPRPSSCKRMARSLLRWLAGQFFCPTCELFCLSARLIGMRVGPSCIKIGALFFAAVISAAVLNSNTTYAGSSGFPSGSVHARLGFAQNRGVGPFGHFSGPFRGRFDRGRLGFGPNIVVLPSVAPPPLYYDAPLDPSLRCFNGWSPEPAYGWC